MTRGEVEFKKNWDEFQKGRKWLYASVAIVEDLELSVGVSEICYTLFRGKLTTRFAGKEMQLML